MGFENREFQRNHKKCKKKKKSIHNKKKKPPYLKILPLLPPKKCKKKKLLSGIAPMEMLSLLEMFLIAEGSEVDAYSCFIIL